MRSARGRDAILRNQYASLADVFGGELPAIYAAKDFVSTAELFFLFFYFTLARSVSREARLLQIEEIWLIGLNFSSKRIG